MPACRVRLDELYDKRKDRFDVLCVIAEEFLSQGWLGWPHDIEVFPHDGAMKAAVDGYFLINRAFKADRLPDGHFIQPAKIAAMSALAFGEFKPLRIIDPNKPIERFNTINANALFSLYWAATVFGDGFPKEFRSKFDVDMLSRYCRLLQGPNLISLTAYKNDVAEGFVRPYYDIMLTHDHSEQTSPLSDMPKIDTMILIFELMCDRRDVGQFED